MSITSVQIYPRKVVEDFIKTFDGDEPVMIDWCLISIIDFDAKPVITDSVKKLLTGKRCLGSITLQFDDLTKTQYDNNFDAFQNKGLTLFNDSDAKQIIKFVDRMHALNNMRLLIHCSAGISRSGAVGTWVTDYLKLDFDKFSKMNPHIFPNVHVMSLLRKQSGMSY